MKAAIFSTKGYDREFLQEANKKFRHELFFFEPRLTPETCSLGFGFPVVCVFVHDQLNRKVLPLLAEHGTRLIALRCAGFNNVDLAAAQELGLKVVRVPAYSPQGVAEHTLALILALNRNIHRAHNRVREGNFSLEGLLGFELCGQTMGIIGTGRIGTILARIMKGFGMTLLAYDPVPNPECQTLGCEYVSLEELFRQSHIISLHLPLMHETYHMINRWTIGQMKPGVMIINTSRGGLIDTQAVIEGLKSGKIGYLGLDVYEEEADLFFEDLSGHVIQDDIFTRLLTFPNVIITGHQAFFTRNALQNISQVTLSNITDFEHGHLSVQNEVTVAHLKAKK